RWRALKTTPMPPGQFPGGPRSRAPPAERAPGRGWRPAWCRARRWPSRRSLCPPLSRAGTESCEKAARLLRHLFLPPMQPVVAPLEHAQFQLRTRCAAKELQTARDGDRVVLQPVEDQRRRAPPGGELRRVESVALLQDAGPQLHVE